MNDFGAAQEWLNANEPGWRIVHGEARLVPGHAEGEPTRRECVAQLHRNDEATMGYDVTAEARGASFVEAVQFFFAGKNQ